MKTINEVKVGDKFSRFTYAENRLEHFEVTKIEKREANDNPWNKTTFSMEAKNLENGKVELFNVSSKEVFDTFFAFYETEEELRKKINDYRLELYRSALSVALAKIDDLKQDFPLYEGNDELEKVIDAISKF